MDVVLENKYISWLYSQVADPNLIEQRETCWFLIRQLYKKEFFWFVDHDDNRVEDGRELRYEFSHETNTKLTPEWHTFGVSMLEVLIALSRRLSFQADGEPRERFWELVDNIGLAKFNDARYNRRAAKTIDDALEKVIWRTYSYSGDGGLFPLKDPKEDQREVELWYQMSAYIISTY